MNLIDQLAGALFPGVSTNPMMQPAALGGPVPSAAPPAGATPPPALANALGAILKQSGAVPTPKAEPAVERPAMAPRSRLQPSGGISAPQPSQGGISGQDVSSIIKAALMGAANVNPGSPMGSAFFQGAGGAVAAQDKFSRDADASKLAAEERALRLEDRELKLDDRAWNRSKDMASEKRATSKEARDKRQADLKMLEVTSKVMKDIDPTLDIKDRIAIERLVRDEGKRLMDKESLQGEELKTKMETYRKDIEERVKGGSGTGALGVPEPAPAAPSGAVKPAPGGTVFGATPESPATGGDGSDRSRPAMPHTQADFDKLPSGAWFINPSDGRVLPKK